MPLRKWTIRLSLYLALVGLVFIAGHAILQPEGGYPPDPNLEKQKSLHQQWTQLFSFLLVIPCIIYSVWGGAYLIQHGPWQRPPVWKCILLTGLLTLINLFHGCLAILAIVFLC